MDKKRTRPRDTSQRALDVVRHATEEPKCDHTWVENPLGGYACCHCLVDVDRLPECEAPQPEGDQYTFDRGGLEYRRFDSEQEALDWATQHGHRSEVEAGILRPKRVRGDALQYEDPGANVGKNPAAVALGRKGGLIGGKRRAENMTPEERSESARHAANERWRKEKGDVEE